MTPGAPPGGARVPAPGLPVAAARVIVLEEDLEVSPDFFDLFAAAAAVLAADSRARGGPGSLLGASAWNDNGQAGHARDARALVRADFFPGLGWMLDRATWDELGPKWPKGYWDDWLREPAQRKGRFFIRPEVSRSRTFGRTGVSSGQFFDEFLAHTVLWSGVPVPWVKFAHAGALDSAHAARAYGWRLSPMPSTT